MKRLLVVLILLTLLVAAALPVLAGGTGTQTLAPGWHAMYPTTAPLARNDHAMAYDSARGVAVLFGGTDGWTVFDDTWEWSSSSLQWSQKVTAHVPPGRYGHAMVYDEARGVVVMFGGHLSGVGYLSDTWEFDGSDWSEIVTADAPEARWLHAMAYDPDRQVIVLHSGQQTTTAGPYGDTWEFDSVNWVEQNIVNPGPPYRSGEGLAYDRQREVMVLFGGDDGPLDYNETWERVGSGDWQQVYPTQSPAARDRMGMVYYTRARMPFLFGGLGSTYFGDVAVYNSQTWLNQTFTPGPSARCCMAMVYDTTRKAVFLFGGAESGTETNDTWYFR